MLKQFPQIFMALKISTSNPLAKAPTVTTANTNEEKPLVAGQGLSAGDTIKTTAGQKVEIKFFIPTEQLITIEENTEVRIKQLATLNCTNAFELVRGKITSEGSHSEIQEIENCASEIQTINSEVRPTGTKYSVDIGQAIAEINGETIQTENYSVEKGSIQIKLRRTKPKSKTIRIAKNATFRLKAGQKAKIKIKSKMKVAEVQVTEH